MPFPRRVFRLSRRHWLTVALLASLPTLNTGAQTVEGQVAKTPITANQADAILRELREIRRVLENIEQKSFAEPRQGPRPPTTATLTIDRDRPALGTADAPVTVVEFTDYQCPFCKRFTQTTFPSIKRDYIDTGKVRWLVHDLPLSFHQNARKAGQAVRCANEQGKFWEMRDTLFKNNANLGHQDLRKYAGDLGLDISAFDACVAGDRHLAEIDKDSAEAGELRITGTPTFVVGRSGGDKLSGKLIIGAQPLNVFAATIQDVLDDTNKAGNPANAAEPRRPGS